MLSSYPKFKKLELGDEEDIEKITGQFPPYSDFNFVSLWCYNTENFCKASTLNNNLLLRYRDYITNKFFYTFIGNNKAVDTIDTLFKLSKREGLEPQLKLIPEVNMSREEEDIHKNFLVEEDPDNADYILSIKKLAELKGPAFHSQKKLVKRFIKQYPRCVFKELDLTNAAVKDDVINLFHLWESQKCKRREETETEFIATQRLLDRKSHLRITPLGVYVEGKLIAYHMEEKLNGIYINGHFAKADINYPGIYQYISNMSAKYFNDLGFSYINAEQDMGLPDLKKAKQLWRPVGYLRKFTIGRKSP